MPIPAFEYGVATLIQGAEKRSVKARVDTETE